MEALVQATSGLVGAWYATSVTYPLDVVKTRLTSQSMSKAKYAGIVDALQKITREEGFGALYAGLQGQFVQTSIGNFSYFYLYEVIKTAALVAKQRILDQERPKQKPVHAGVRRAQHATHVIGSPSTAVIAEIEDAPVAEAHLNVLENLAVGVVAGIIQQLLITPLNVAMVRIKTKKPPAQHSSSLFVVLYLLLKQDGFFTLYSGIVPSLVLTINPAIQFMIFDKLKHWWAPDAVKTSPKPSKRSRLADAPQSSPAKAGKKVSSAATFFIGAIAKIVATLVTYPYVLARVRMQVSRKKKSTLQVLAQVLRKSGIRGLYAGLQAQLIKSVLFSALLFMAKEKISHLTRSLLVR